MSASRAALGDRWLDVYLTSPAWRFMGEAGSCGPLPILGLTAPSVDRVGRYFPLTIAAELPPETPLPATSAVSMFFDQAERLVVETLEAEHVDFESFDHRVSGLIEHLGFVGVPPPVTLDRGAAAILDGGVPTGWHIPLGSIADISCVLEHLLLDKLGASYHPLMLWWSDGSSDVDPSCLVVRGLPAPSTYAALLDGSWTEHQWRAAPARVHRRDRDDLAADGRSLSFRSAGVSDAGRVRHVNQDAFIERTEIGLWAVADGLGGHSSGELASRMVCDALADFTPRTFDETIDGVRTRLQEVNQHLVMEAARSLLGDRSGSTVVALIARGSRCAVLWAGDSRVYRLRGGRLDQLTKDHSPAAVAGAGPHESYAVTRAVGAQSALELDLCSEQVRAGDRYLLCSDGLTRVVPESQIRLLAQAPDLRAAASGLVEATLAAGAPDNVTAVVVEAVDFV